MKQQLALNPENKDIKFEIIKKLVAGNFENDAVDFIRKISTPKEVVRYFNNRGVELSKNGDVEGAIREYELALKFFPK